MTDLCPDLVQGVPSVCGYGPFIGYICLSGLSSLFCIKPPLSHLVITITYVWMFNSCAVKGIRPLLVTVVLGGCIQSICMYI